MTSVSLLISKHDKIKTGLQAELLNGQRLLDEPFQCEFNWEKISKRVKICVAKLETLSNDLDASLEKLSLEVERNNVQYNLELQMKEDFELLDTALETSDKLTTMENSFAKEIRQSEISQQKTSDEQFEEIIKRQSKMLQQFLSLQIVSQQEGEQLQKQLQRIKDQHETKRNSQIIMMLEYRGISADDYQVKGVEQQLKGSNQVEKDKIQYIHQNNGRQRQILQNQNQKIIDLEYQKTSNSSDKAKESWEKELNKTKVRGRHRRKKNKPRRKHVKIKKLRFKGRYWKRKRLHTYNHKKSKINKGKQKHNRLKRKSRHPKKRKIRSKRMRKQQHWSKKQVQLGVNKGQRIFTCQRTVSHRHSKKFRWSRARNARRQRKPGRGKAKRHNERETRKGKQNKRLGTETSRMKRKKKKQDAAHKLKMFA